MTITNKLNLPEPIYQRAVQDSKSREGLEHFMSVTELLNPPWLEQLSKKHYHETVIDCSGEIWAMLGSAFHKYLDIGDDTYVIREKRFYATIANERISGQIDYYDIDTCTLIDYKTTSKYTIKNKLRMSEWTLQANFYAHLLRINNYPVDNLELVVIARDWSPFDKYKKDGLQHQVVKIPLELYDHDKCQAFIASRINLHKLPARNPCCDQDTWVRKDGTHARCLEYCDVNKFCSKYKRHIRTKMRDN